MNLPGAIKALRQGIIDEGFSPDLLTETAADFQVHPKLLERKFEEQYGKSPELYVPPIVVPPSRQEVARKEFDAIHAAANKNGWTQEDCDKLNALAEDAGYNGGWHLVRKRRKRAHNPEYDFDRELRKLLKLLSP